MLKLKKCPRCKGDLIFESDQYGSYEQCLQCGYLDDLEAVVQGQTEPVEWEKDREKEMARAA